MKRFAILFSSIWIFSSAHATNYYLDSQHGSDDKSGTTSDNAWQSLSMINDVTLQPGDSVLFKCGSVWDGPFAPQGSGSEGHQIVVSKYGSGSLPRINGWGAPFTILLLNLEYFELLGGASYRLILSISLAC